MGGLEGMEGCTYVIGLERYDVFLHQSRRVFTSVASFVALALVK